MTLLERLNEKSKGFKVEAGILEYNGTWVAMIQKGADENLKESWMPTPNASRVVVGKFGKKFPELWSEI